MPDKIYTRCNDCIFKLSNESGEESGSQTGCLVGRLETFKNIGTDMEWNKHTKSFVINRVCNMKRLEKWAENKIDIIASVNVETKVKVDIIVVVPNHMNYSQAAASTCKTLKQCTNQSIKPSSIIIITYNKEVEKNIKKFWEDVVLQALSNSEIKYNMIRGIGKTKELNEMIDEAVVKCVGQYYCILESGDKIEPDVVFRINDIINHKMERFLYIIPTHITSGYPRVVHTGLHKMLDGYGDGDIIEKIKEKMQEQSKPEFGRFWSI